MRVHSDSWQGTRCLRNTRARICRSDNGRVPPVVSRAILAGMSAIRPCSICASQVTSEINAALARREKLRDFEKRSSFSRAALSRHPRKCLARTAIEEHASWNTIRTDLASGKARLVPVYPGDAVPLVGDHDVILRISFEDPPRPRPPRPLIEVRPKPVIAADDNELLN